MKIRNAPEAKSKILRAAQKLFAEKGFDGARVDDIAAEAGVNKALIYYYFKSKRNLLEELFSNLIEELMEVSYGLIGDDLDFESEEKILQLEEIIYDFMDEREEILKIMMMESLKASEEVPPLFKFVEVSLSDDAEKLKEEFRDRGFDIDSIDIAQHLIADFFTGMIPMISFVVYRDKWSKHFGIDKEELKEKFLAVFQETHLAYHKAELQRMR